MITVALLVAVATLLAGLAVAFLAGRLPSLRGQIIAVALAAVALSLGAVMLGGALMLSSVRDVTVLAALVAAGVSALAGAWLIGRRLLTPLAELRHATQRIADGDFSARAAEGAPRELGELGRSFNAMAHRLEEVQDARTQLVAWASHDLRTPLASLQAMLEAVQDGVVAPEQYIDAMADQVTSLGAMVDDLFELARLDAGALSMDLRDVSLEQLVDSCVRGAQAEAQARGVSLVGLVSDNLPPVRCAPDKVQRVLLNLTTNALRHTPDDGTIMLRVDGADDAVVVSVDDSGEGLSEEARRRMFDRFWRGDRARVRDGAGAGLGLAIAQGLVEAHGGTIWAENRPEGGARVAFSLPTAAVG